jgi:4-hydroxy-tetrahydrodipicolinate reductase
MIRVAICGAAGRMGREVTRAVSEADDMQVVAAIDLHHLEEDAGSLAGISPLGVKVESDWRAAAIRTRPEVMVDFSVHTAVLPNALVALELGISPVIGTTGLSDEEVAILKQTAQERRIGAFLAPNFAIGAVLMMQFAAQAARYLPDVEIIELHHEKKVDAPSGTAMLTAQRIAEARRAAGVHPSAAPEGAFEKAPGARGGLVDGVPVHSVRLPGFVAHQEVILGGVGQTLTLRHDSTDRRSFMPGVLLAIRKVRSLSGLVIGLENLL